MHSLFNTHGGGYLFFCFQVSTSRGNGGEQSKISFCNPWSHTHKTESLCLCQGCYLEEEIDGGPHRQGEWRDIRWVICHDFYPGIVRDSYILSGWFFLLTKNTRQEFGLLQDTQREDYNRQDELLCISFITALIAIWFLLQEYKIYIAFKTEWPSFFTPGASTKWY